MGEGFGMPIHTGAPEAVRAAAPADTTPARIPADGALAPRTGHASFRRGRPADVRLSMGEIQP